MMPLILITLFATMMETYFAPDAQVSAVVIPAEPIVIFPVAGADNSLKLIRSTAAIEDSTVIPPSNKVPVIHAIEILPVVSDDHVPMTPPPGIFNYTETTIGTIFNIEVEVVAATIPFSIFASGLWDYIVSSVVGGMDICYWIRKVLGLRNASSTRTANSPPPALIVRSRQIPSFPAINGAFASYTANIVLDWSKRLFEKFNFLPLALTVKTTSTVLLLTNGSDNNGVSAGILAHQRVAEILRKHRKDVKAPTRCFIIGYSEEEAKCIAKWDAQKSIVVNKLKSPFRRTLVSQVSMKERRDQCHVIVTVSK